MGQRQTLFSIPYQLNGCPLSFASCLYGAAKLQNIHTACLARHESAACQTPLPAYASPQLDQWLYRHHHSNHGIHEGRANNRKRPGLRNNGAEVSAGPYIHVKGSLADRGAGCLLAQTSAKFESCTYQDGERSMSK